MNVKVNQSKQVAHHVLVPTKCYSRKHYHAEQDPNMFLGYYTQDNKLYFLYKPVFV